MSSASDRPTREVMARRGVNCFRDCTRMDGVEESEPPPGLEDTADGPVVFISWLPLAPVSIDSVATVCDGACDCDSTAELLLVLAVSGVPDWAWDSSETGTESSGGAVVEWESDLLSMAWELGFTGPAAFWALSSFAATASRMNPSHTKAR